MRKGFLGIALGALLAVFAAILYLSGEFLTTSAAAILPFFSGLFCCYALSEDNAILGIIGSLLFAGFIVFAVVYPQIGVILSGGIGFLIALFVVKIRE